MSKPVAVNAADVRPEKVRWLWPKYIPLGKVTVVDGDPEQGKSTFSIDLAARLTTGSPMPDGSRTEADAWGVVMINGEDGAADTMVPRLESARADRHRVEFLDSVLAPGDDGVERERAVTLPFDLGAIESLVETATASLVVVDPLAAFLDEGINSHRDQDVRRALMPLSRLAERRGIAILLVRHLNKTEGGKALYRGGGSIGIIGAARSGLIIAVDPDDEGRRVLAVVKSNLSRKPPALAFRLVPDELQDCARIVWEGQCRYRADDLVAARAKVDPDDTAALAAACDWLTDLLTNNEPWDGKEPWAKEVRDEVNADKRFGWRTVQRAAARIRVDSHHVGKPGDKEQGWKWRLPAGAAYKTPGRAQERQSDNDKSPGHAQERQTFPQERQSDNDKSPGHAQERQDAHIYTDLALLGDEPDEEGAP